MLIDKGLSAAAILAPYAVVFACSVWRKFALLQVEALHAEVVKQVKQLYY